MDLTLQLTVNAVTHTSCGTFDMFAQTCTQTGYLHTPALLYAVVLSALLLSHIHIAMLSM